MYIIHIASELAPIAKVGGLADVIGGLSTELANLGHDVDVIIPKYDCMHSDGVTDLRVVYENLNSFYEGEWHANTIWEGWVGNQKVYFIDPRHKRHFFDRGCIYGCDDDIDRFLYFSRAAMEFLFKVGLHPDVLHLHDWQTGIIPVLYYDMYKKWGYNHSKIIFTVHNIAYQGKCATWDLDRIGLVGGHYSIPDKLQDNASPNTINLLKGGIVYSNAVTTVSPTYAKEILTPTGGQGLEATLKKYEGKLSGILNGVDYAYWNPETDKMISAHYSSREFPRNVNDRKTIDKKAYIKKVFRENLQLEESHRPVIGCIARLVPQKGLDAIKYAIENVSGLGGQFVFLGSGPIPSVNAEFHILRQQYGDHPNVRVVLLHDEHMAHMLYAACDMLLVPSLFEPCGLVQLIALRYGTVPIVHKTGGLTDTIFDLNCNPESNGNSNGFTYSTPQDEFLENALKRAIDCWFREPDVWRQLVIRGMTQDFSWKQSAQSYLDLYSKPVL